MSAGRASLDLCSAVPSVFSWRYSMVVDSIHTQLFADMISIAYLAEIGAEDTRAYSDSPHGPRLRTSPFQFGQLAPQGTFYASARGPFQGWIIHRTLCNNFSSLHCCRPTILLSTEASIDGYSSRVRPSTS